MDTISVLLIVFLIAATAVCAVAVFALLRATETLRSAQVFFDHMDERLVPLLEKTDVTVDAVNAELLRVDAIVTQWEEVSDNVSTATHAVREAANVPAGVVNAVGSKVRSIVKDMRR